VRGRARRGLRSSLFDIVELREFAQVAVVLKRGFEKRRDRTDERFVALLVCADPIQLRKPFNANGDVAHRVKAESVSKNKK